MPHIQPLEPHIAELIAAGEVVERPASVVKELVENALDAGATVITVEMERGGMGLIRVTDNGCGIAPDELPVAFLRHATSKVHELADLSAIGTLGFRGEALASICAVSRVQIRTREKNALTGALLRLEGGEHGDVEETGAPEGTSIEIRDLFFNTPARLKFMRRDSTEAGKIGALMEQLALSHPETSFRLVRDGADVLHTPGDGQLLSAIYAALGREFAASLIPVDGRGGNIQLNGYVTIPVHGRGSRAMQTFFVNGRFVKVPLLTSALEEAYKNQMLKGKFPGCVLFLTLPLPEVDVNVHPAKTQVKFAREQDIFRTVYHVVLDALNASGSPAGLHPVERSSHPASRAETMGIPSTDGTSRMENGQRFHTGSMVPKADFFRRMDAQTYREWQSGQQESGIRIQADPLWDQTEEKISGKSSRVPDNPYRIPETSADPDAFIPAIPPDNSPEQGKQRDSFPEQDKRDSSAFPIEDESVSPANDESVSPTQDKSVSPAQDNPTAQNGGSSNARTLSGQQTFPETVQPWRIAGEIWRTYILCESAEGAAYLIDKHAAHERINFNRLQAGDVSPMRQTLLVPEAVELSAEDVALILEHQDLLGQLGFTFEEFGHGTLLVREIPADMEISGIAATFEELAENLRTGRGTNEQREAVLRTVACKASIRGGEYSDERELRELVRRVQSGEIRYCPHGRPVVREIRRREVEKLFKRT